MSTTTNKTTTVDIADDGRIDFWPVFSDDAEIKVVESKISKDIYVHVDVDGDDGITSGYVHTTFTPEQALELAQKIIDTLGAQVETRLVVKV